MTIKKEIIHKNPWFSLEKHELKNNDVYYFLSKKPAVFIIAKDINNKVALIEEFRYPVRKNILQLPAGMVEEGSSLTAAKRELYEETKIIAKSWKKLATFYVASGHEDTQIIVYQAKSLKVERNTTLEKDIKSIKWYSNTEIKNLIRQNKIECGITLASLVNYFID